MTLFVDETLMNRLAPVLDAGDITPDFPLNYDYWSPLKQGFDMLKLSHKNECPSAALTASGVTPKRMEVSMLEHRSSLLPIVELTPDTFLREWYYRSLSLRQHFGEDACACVDPGTPNGVMCDRCSLALERNASVLRERKGKGL